MKLQVFNMTNGSKGASFDDADREMCELYTSGSQLYLGRSIDGIMCLNREHVQAMIPLLVRFAHRGTLDELSPEEQSQGIEEGLR